MSYKDFESIANLTVRSFIYEFEYCYDSIYTSGKTCLLKYIYSFFRKWYYSSIIPGQKISPAAILSNECENYIPVLKCKSKLRMSYNNINFSIAENTLNNSVIIQDINTIYNNAQNGIYEDSLNLYTEDFFNKIRKLLIIDDPEYINYLIYLMERLDILKLMPSIGVNIRCINNNKVLNLSNEELFKVIFKEAVSIAADKLNMYSINNPIEYETVIDWLKNQADIDTIFNEYFSVDSAEDIDTIYDLDGFGEENPFLIINKRILFDAGITFDQWFLTPLGLYMGIIEPVYTAPYMIFDELSIFVDLNKTKNDFDFDASPAFALYSPSTSFKLTGIGIHMLDLNIEKDKLYIFNTYSAERLSEIIFKNEIDRYCRDIIFNSEPTYNVYKLKISFLNDKLLWLSINVKESFCLYNLCNFSVHSAFGNDALIQNAKFYTLPKNPFTEFVYPVESKRKANVYNKTIDDIFSKYETIYLDFSFVKFDKYVECSFKIDLVSISENTIKTSVPSVLSKSKKLNQFFVI